MTVSSSNNVAAEPCPRCGSTDGLVWVHGHGQCATCGSNVHDCCQGSECDLAPAASLADGDTGD